MKYTFSKDNSSQNWSVSKYLIILSQAKHSNLCTLFKSRFNKADLQSRGSALNILK